MGKKIKVTLIKSPIDAIDKHKFTLRALGLRKINDSNKFNDSPQIIGMIKKVIHLIKVEENTK